MCRQLEPPPTVAPGWLLVRNNTSVESGHFAEIHLFTPSWRGPPLPGEVDSPHAGVATCWCFPGNPYPANLVGSPHAHPAAGRILLAEPRSTSRFLLEDNTQCEDLSSITPVDCACVQQAASETLTRHQVSSDTNVPMEVSSLRRALRHSLNGAISGKQTRDDQGAQRTSRRPLLPRTQRGWAITGQAEA
jgi:hypothetical protein